MTTATYRTPWLRKFRRENEDARLRFTLELCLFDDDGGFSLCFFGFWFPLYFLDRFAYEPHEMMESWGFTYCRQEACIHLNWGRHCKIIDMPWDWSHIKHEVRRPDGSWVPHVGSYEVGPDKPPDGRWAETYPFRYVLNSGEVQNRMATVYVDRHERRRKFLKWCPWFASKQPYIWVEFNDEVGEGGTVGCGYELRRNETPLECLRRMERERRFR